jgi:LysM repeat protein
MSGKSSPQDVIASFQRRQRMMPFLIGGLAALLIIIGIIILVAVLSRPGGAIANLFATSTPTATSTFTPTATVPTPTPTLTSTATITPTVTATQTPSGPQQYEVKQGDTCWDIAVKFKVDLATLLAINNFPAGQCPIIPGQSILIPMPGQALPTATLQDVKNLPRNTIIEYTIRINDTMESIASLFNSTVEAIMAIKSNAITDKATIYVGQVIKIPVNLVTPTPTRQPTSTLSGPTKAPTATATFTKTP